MKPITYLFVDFENVQPPAEDFARVRGDEYRLWLFHGPHQNKFDADVVTAWQPLGERVRFVQAARRGKNALDFHIAFCLGQAQQHDAAQGSAARYLVVSNDTGFDALLEHMQTLGCQTARAASIAQALRIAEPAPAARAPRQGAGTRSGAAAAASRTAAKAEAASGSPTRRAKAATRSPAAEPPPQARPSASRPTPAKPAVRPSTAEKKPARKATSTATAAKAPATRKSAAALRNTLADSDVDTVIAALRARATHRPADREALRRHIVSVLRHQVTTDVSDAVIDALQARELISFAGHKVRYSLPKPGK
jgi:hypothetical protein